MGMGEQQRPTSTVSVIRSDKVVQVALNLEWKDEFSQRESPARCATTSTEWPARACSWRPSTRG